MNCIAKILGRKVSIEFHQPTNEEYNLYSDQVHLCVKTEDEKGLVALRCRQFDQWAGEITGIDKAAIPDKIKSSVMFQVYEYVEVEEKN